MSIREISDGLQHIGIPVKDLAATEKFYDQIGFSPIFRGEVPDTKKKVVFMKLGNMVVECYESDVTAGVPGAIDHMTINVSDVDAAYRYIDEIGLNNAEDGMQFLPFFENGVRFFIITGPNGEKVEFNQYL